MSEPILTRTLAFLRSPATPHFDVHAAAGDVVVPAAGDRHVLDDLVLGEEIQHAFRMLSASRRRRSGRTRESLNPGVRLPLTACQPIVVSISPWPITRLATSHSRGLALPLERGLITSVVMPFRTASARTVPYCCQ